MVSVSSRASYASSSHHFLLATLEHSAVSGWRKLSSVHGTKILHQGQRGWGWFPYSRITTVSCTWRCTKCTWRLVRIAALLWNLYTRHTRISTRPRQGLAVCSGILLGDRGGEGGISLGAAFKNMFCLPVHHQQPCRKVLLTVWATDTLFLEGLVGRPLSHNLYDLWEGLLITWKRWKTILIVFNALVCRPT